MSYAELLDIVAKGLGNAASRIVEDQRAKNIRASGQSADSLEIRELETSRELWGSHYFYFEEHGRKSGKRPPMISILEWIRVKGIRPKDISEKSLAFLIARKIGEKGTNIYQGLTPALAFMEILEQEFKSVDKQLDAMITENIDQLVIEGLDKIFKQ